MILQSRLCMLLTSLGIANAMFFFLLAVKRKKQRKLSAAPASLKGCAIISGVVAEPDDPIWTVNGGVVLLVFLLSFQGNHCSDVAIPYLHILRLPRSARNDDLF